MFDDAFELQPKLSLNVQFGTLWSLISLQR